jgi:hypothetical protein
MSGAKRLISHGHPDHDNADHGPRHPRTVGRRGAPIASYGLHVSARSYSTRDPQRVLSTRPERSRVLLIIRTIRPRVLNESLSYFGELITAHSRRSTHLHEPVHARLVRTDR